MQPFQGRQQIIIERRHPDGSLDFRGEPQPPTVRHACGHHDESPGVTFDRLYELYFREVPDGVGSWEALSAWLKSKGWTIRAKTW